MSSSKDPPSFTHEEVSVGVALISVAAYNVVELILWIFDFFRRYRGCYFWSIIAAISGLTTVVISDLLELRQCYSYKAILITRSFGYIIMDTGCIMVLYSRIHLVNISPTLHLVVIVVVATVCIIQVPYFITHFAAPKSPAFFAFEHFVVTGSAICEFFLAGIYIWSATRNLRPVLIAKGQEGRRVARSLIMASVFLGLLDGTYIVAYYVRARSIQTGLIVLVTSIKLKMEFAILNKLAILVQSASPLNHISTAHLSDDDQPPDNRPTFFDPRPLHATAVILSPPRALSFDRLTHSSLDHSSTEVSSVRGRRYSRLEEPNENVI
ncbi:hypothetical protein BDV25DRAFT_136998 [Aspergillus avenaceus]|uniref:DUF7703 domain-containing protein n=1 Tax=Aspergillus avenaceus TaxID=36643 RepID=A0A5N6U476_ASPAV|nr:hypothetical protein BDV25DRAFT_136998 [Aspergillus avenaceus]